MKVLFLKHVINVWKPWEIKEVKSGYATNFLFPKWFALEFTPEEEKKHFEKLKKQDLKRRELVENKYNLSQKLNWEKLEFILKKWNNQKVYWWIWEKDIISKIKNKYKIELSKKHIQMPDWHIKKIWEHIIYIKFWKDAMSKVYIIISWE